MMAAFYVKLFSGPNTYWVAQIDKPGDISAWIVGITQTRRDAIPINQYEVGQVIDNLLRQHGPNHVEILIA